MRTFKGPVNLKRSWEKKESEYNITVEQYSSMHEAMRVVSQREPMEEHENSYFFNGHGKHNPEFLGFSSEEEFRNICTTGI